MNAFLRTVGVLTLAILLAREICVSQQDGNSLFRRNPNYGQQTGLYTLYRTRSAEIVMLGNSITFGVNWNEFLGRSGVVNRGIPSDLLEGFLHRLEGIIQLHPAVVCIMGGINDLYEDIHPDTVFVRYRAVVDTLRKHGIVPIIQSTLFVSPRWKRYEKKNLAVAQLNDLLRAFADWERLEYLDLNAVLSRDGVLQEEFTTDGVHLTPRGYELWRNALEPVLMKYVR
jgi:lysophospholipase L1-like esterase